MIATKQIRKLEYQLEQSKGEQRMPLLEQLIYHFAFTDVKKAQKYLYEQRDLLQIYAYPDIELTYNWHTAYIENLLYNYTLSEIHYARAIELVEERGDVRQQIELQLDCVGTFINAGKNEETYYFLRKAERLLENFTDILLEARLIIREGFLHLRDNNVSKAIQLFLEAERHYDTYTASDKPLSLKDCSFMTLMYSGLGRIYEITNEIEKGVKAYLRVVNICESFGIRTRLAHHYRNVGNSYMALQDLENAENYFQKSLDASDDISQTARASTYANLGKCRATRGFLEEALTFFKKAEYLLHDNPTKENFLNLAVIEKYRAEVNTALGKPKRTLKNLNRALELAQQADDLKQLSIACEDIANYYASVGDFKNAYEFQLHHERIGEDYREQVNQQRIHELEVKYETEKREKETELLKLQAIQLQHKALRAQMNPHFIFNALNAIQNYINSDRNEEAAHHLAKFAELMRNSLHLSEEENISLETEIDFLRAYLNINQKLRFENQLNYQIDIADDLEEDIIGVPTMILQPYVENAIEHGLRPKRGGFILLTFSLTDDERYLRCTVQDDGMGRAKVREMQQQSGYHERHRSRGTEITEARLRLLHGSDEVEFIQIIDLYNEENVACGTKVEILLPYSEEPYIKEGEEEGEDE
jgi:two-component system, LytTR family, sensor kinase